jgi:hypothetical protein
MCTKLGEKSGSFPLLDSPCGERVTTKVAVFLALVGFFSLSTARPVSAHPIPDGVVFRGIQVVVWSQRIEIRYQLGLSDNMIQEELRASLASGTEIPEEPGRALRVYRDVMFPRLPEKISVTIDHQPQKLTLRRADVIRQHHIQIELVYRIDFTVPEKPAYFLLIDDNFQGIPGYHLAGIRGRGLVDVPESNAVPVLSRLSREPETEEELRILSTPVRRIEAMIAAIVENEAPEAPETPSEATDSAAVPFLIDRSAAESVGSSLDLPPAPPEGSRSDPLTLTAHGRRWIWPVAGCLLMLVAVVWMVFIVRRS